VDAARRSGLDQNGNMRLIEIPGKGVRGYLDDSRTILVGKQSFLAEEGVDLHGSTIGTGNSAGSHVLVAVDGKVAGLITLVDELRHEAGEATRLLKAKGVRIVMLTGDNETTAREVANELGIDEYYAGLLPEDKVRIAKELAQRYGEVAMVGDGVNDAPVLAASNVGIAVGSAGNDVAIEVADVALMGSDLRTIPYLLELGRKVVSKLRVNIVLALALKFLLIALGTLGFIPLWVGVIGDDGLTLVLIANALPLLRFKS